MLEIWGAYLEICCEFGGKACDYREICNAYVRSIVEKHRIDARLIPNVEAYINM